MKQEILAKGGLGVIFLQVYPYYLHIYRITYSRRLTLEYARLMSVDRESMSYKDD